ncbi:synembryn-A-like [Heptranchias perlo]|uniref:synembryn-A-like n=1 Tax=Heptranchias perlo TaxID=212740 RepID=UPI00355A1058
MELSRVIERVESGEQDSALPALQLHNTANSQRFLFEAEEREQRRKLGKLVMKFLERDLQPACQVACLETVRILSRDKSNLRAFTTRRAILTLAKHAGIDCCEQRVDGMPDLDVIVEALKCLCNVVFNSPAAQEIGAETRLVVGLSERVKLYNDRSLTHDIKFFDFRLLFLFTALRVDVRAQLGHELRGVSLLTDALENSLSVRWSDTYEVVGAGVDEDPLSRQQTDCVMEILKILFNVTFDLNKREVDEEDAALYRHLVAILRHCLLIEADGEDRMEEVHRWESALTHQVLPPLRDVQTRPEVGNLLRNKLVRLMTHIDTDLKRCAAEFLFVLCKESVARFVKYTGYGNAAGLLAARGLMGGARAEGMYSEDEDTDTEEYKEAKANINPVTGRVEEVVVNPMDRMTDEQKEYEAMKLFNMFDKLSREKIIQPMGVAPDGKMAPFEEAMHQLADRRELSDSDSDSD